MKRPKQSRKGNQMAVAKCAVKAGAGMYGGKENKQEGAGAGRKTGQSVILNVL